MEAYVIIDGDGGRSVYWASDIMEALDKHRHYGHFLHDVVAVYSEEEAPRLI